ncbi:hypothetical protein D3C86_759160 [compost metagenome]
MQQAEGRGSQSRCDRKGAEDRHQGRDLSPEPAHHDTKTRALGRSRLEAVGDLRALLDQHEERRHPGSERDPDVRELTGHVEPRHLDRAHLTLLGLKRPVQVLRVGIDPFHRAADALDGPLSAWCACGQVVQILDGRLYRRTVGDDFKRCQHVHGRLQLKKARLKRALGQRKTRRGGRVWESGA